MISNTRLETKNDFDELRDNFFSNRTNLEQNIIKPINQDDFVNFHNFIHPLINLLCKYI